ncbi:helix-turn-helix transcriptional regulator [Paenibacillus cremeus]|nr:helix-turn-helix transcriptional regulator [Paenibacillus cremeus]
MSINGTMIRLLRVLYGLSQKDLADLIGCSDVYISYLETEKRRVTDRMTVRIRSELSLTDSEIRDLNELSQSTRRGVVLGNVPKHSGGEGQ